MPTTPAAFGLALLLAAAAHAAPAARITPFYSGDRASDDTFVDLTAAPGGDAWVLATQGGGFKNKRFLLWKLGKDARPAPKFPVAVDLGLEENTRANSLAAASDGSVYVVGTVSDHPAVWKFGADGTPAPGYPRVWGLRFAWLGNLFTLRTGLSAWIDARSGTMSSDRVSAAAADPDGNLWLTGSHRRITGLKDGDFVYAPSGIELWKMHPDGTLFEGFPKIFDLDESSDSLGRGISADRGGVWIFGRSDKAATASTALLRTDTNGAPVGKFPIMTDDRALDRTETDPRTKNLLFNEAGRVARDFFADENGATWVANRGKGCQIDRIGSTGARPKGFPGALPVCAQSAAGAGEDVWLVAMTGGGASAWRWKPAANKNGTSAQWKPGKDEGFLVRSSAAGPENSLWVGGGLQWGAHGRVGVYKIDP